MNCCPKCASENIQRAEVAWGLGTKLAGPQSLMAAFVAPPTEKKAIGGRVAVGLGVLIALFGLLMLAGGGGADAAPIFILASLPLIAGIAIVLAADRYNSETLPALISEYRARWLCLKCGEVFKVERLDSAPAEDQPSPDLKVMA